MRRLQRLAILLPRRTEVEFTCPSGTNESRWEVWRLTTEKEEHTMANTAVNASAAPCKIKRIAILRLPFWDMPFHD